MDAVDAPDSFVIGVDYGTLSGRAVVVRVRDGKELGSGVYDYPHAVVTGALPEDRQAAVLTDNPCAFPGNGPFRCRTTTVTSCAMRFPQHWLRLGSTRPPSSALPPTSPPAPWCR